MQPDNSTNSDIKGDILIVDDTPANLRVLSATLRDRGYEVRCVNSGAMALTVSQNAPPDLILLDIKMPEMDGYQVCQQLKSDIKTHEIPVIFLSALDDASDKIKAFTAEAALKNELQKIQQQILTTSTVELDSHQLAALTSFAFNVGVESLFKSTLFTKLNAGDFIGAANELPRWNQANMGRRLVPLAGLTKRRFTERNLFLTGVN
ncbi:MAG: response regulator [Pleurocapsa sp. MO_192.B19]|nr:response regulator [Pleurocapsa sp. MO_192.B19]